MKARWIIGTTVLVALTTVIPAAAKVTAAEGGETGQ